MANGKRLAVQEITSWHRFTAGWLQLADLQHTIACCNLHSPILIKPHETANRIIFPLICVGVIWAGLIWAGLGCLNFYPPLGAGEIGAWRRAKSSDLTVNLGQR